jgi:hypothetical protein
VSAEELTRAEIRAALHEMQGGRCAVCGVGGRIQIDHDHATGMVRGLLCQSCNIRERGGLPHADIKAYRANPPAAGRDWFWDWPDTWTLEDTAAIWKLMPGRKHSMGIPISVILEYMPEHLERAAARQAALEKWWVGGTLPIVLEHRRRIGTTTLDS